MLLFVISGTNTILPILTQWPSYKTYNADEIEALLEPSSNTYDDLAIYFFVQYHLYVQLKQATQYAHRNGVIVKGDIPIGDLSVWCRCMATSRTYFTWICRQERHRMILQ